MRVPNLPSMLLVDVEDRLTPGARSSFYSPV